MTRGRENVEKGLLDNEDTKYYLAHKDKVKEEKPKKKTKSKETE